MLAAFRRPHGPRRGVTLVEMLVVVALVVLMMVILVQIFQAATGAMIAARTTQDLDIVLRSIDSTIRSDLAGVTAKMTPPNDPTLKQGYFEYGENAFADLQGEDTDDYIAFTTKAPEGQVFYGRQFISGKTSLGSTVNPAIQPITISSQLAEVAYFLRNGNLYRRVFLVAPARSKSIAAGTGGGGATLPTSMFGLSPNLASWQGMNDISCRPNITNAAGTANLPPIPNDLGDLTNRENRRFSPRFSNDFTGNASGGPDGIPDDNNADGIPDYYPTLYYDGLGHPIMSGKTSVDWLPNASMFSYFNVVPFPTAGIRTQTNPYDVYAFPFIYPGMYSVPDGASVSKGTVTPPTSNLGWHHGLFPGTDVNGNVLINHGPLDVGDNLPAPTLSQTWWGFPTWRETLTAFNGTVGWSDPIVRVNTHSNAQPLGLRPFAPNQTYMLNSTTFLPQLTQLGSTSTPPYTDGAAGSASFVAVANASNASQQAYPNPVWEDDLILTGVRSFDVKAYDIDAPLYNSATSGPFSVGYLDLGFGAGTYLGGWTKDAKGNLIVPPFQTAPSFEPIGFGHEGRIPAIGNDFRHDPRRPLNQIGDDNTGVIRLTRVFDTWSTDYTNAPDYDLFLDGYGAAQPIYPAFPAPYPSALRGIQIQIRVVNPRNERPKTLTIRHDFTDKLTN